MIDRTVVVLYLIVIKVKIDNIMNLWHYLKLYYII